MSSGTKLTKSAVWVDSGRNVDDKTVGVALIYDPDRQCYYQTTIAGIATHVASDVDERLSKKEAEIDAKIKALEEKQEQFIADMTKANASVIDLVEKTITEDN